QMGANIFITLTADEEWLKAPERVYPVYIDPTTTLATNADAFSIGQNNGKAAKQIIPHVHIHIIPRYDSKGTVWTKRQISNDEELSELAKKIRNILT
ncbi:MAG: HIT domain-containing protein, partial [Nitrosopumilus sp.]